MSTYKIIDTNNPVVFKVYSTDQKHKQHLLGSLTRLEKHAWRNSLDNTVYPTRERALRALANKSAYLFTIRQSRK